MNAEEARQLALKVNIEKYGYVLEEVYKEVEIAASEGKFYAEISLKDKKMEFGTFLRVVRADGSGYSCEWVKDMARVIW